MASTYITPPLKLAYVFASSLPCPVLFTDILASSSYVTVSKLLTMLFVAEESFPGSSFSSNGPVPVTLFTIATELTTAESSVSIAEPSSNTCVSSLVSACSSTPCLAVSPMKLNKFVFCFRTTKSTKAIAITNKGIAIFSVFLFLLFSLLCLAFFSPLAKMLLSLSLSLYSAKVFKVLLLVVSFHCFLSFSTFIDYYLYYIKSSFHSK